MALSAELRSRAQLPEHVGRVLSALPEGTHPMTQFSAAVLALQVLRPRPAAPPPPQPVPRDEQSSG